MDRSTRQNTFMPMATFSKIAAELALWPARPKIYLNIFGEPLLDSHLADKLELLNKLNLAQHTVLQTNATRLKGDIVDAILDNNVGLLVPCLESLDAQIFEKIRFGAKLDNVLPNIVNFILARNHKDAITKISFQHVRTKLNQLSHNKIYRTLGRLMRSGDSINMPAGHYWATGSLAECFPSLLDYEIGQIKTRCSMMDSFLNIDVDGNILSCCWDYNHDNWPVSHDMNIHGGRTLLDLWHDDRFSKLQKK